MVILDLIRCLFWPAAPEPTRQCPTRDEQATALLRAIAPVRPQEQRPVPVLALPRREEQRARPVKRRRPDRMRALLAPTLRTDGERYGADVVGESHYIDGINRDLGDLSLARPRGIAELVREPENPYDANAVEVYLDGRMVGHLPRAVAAEAQPALVALETAGIPALCPAEIRGARYEYPGVWLDLALPVTAAVPECAALDGSGRSLQLIAEDHKALRALLGGADEVSWVVELRPERDATVGAYADGRWIGRMSPRSARKWIPLLEQIRDRGWPSTVVADIADGPAGPSATIRLPDLSG